MQDFYIPFYSKGAKEFNLEAELSIHLKKAAQILTPPSGQNGVFTFGDLWPSKN